MERELNQRFEQELKHRLEQELSKRLEQEVGRRVEQELRSRLQDGQYRSVSDNRLGKLLFFLEKLGKRKQNISYGMTAGAKKIHM